MKKAVIEMDKQIEKSVTENREEVVDEEIEHKSDRQAVS